MIPFEIEEYLRHGADRATSKAQLCRMTGLNDRTVRAAIKNARDRGVLIVSTSGGSGYYLAATEEDRQIIQREYGSRIRTMAETYKAIRKAPLSAR